MSKKQSEYFVSILGSDKTFKARKELFNLGCRWAPSARAWFVPAHLESAAKKLISDLNPVVRPLKGYAISIGTDQFGNEDIRNHADHGNRITRQEAERIMSERGNNEF